MVAFAKPTHCPICASSLEPYLSGIADVVYGVPGEWDLVRCPDKSCGAIFLAHDLSGNDIAGFYATYSTHSKPVLDVKGLKRFYRLALQHIWHRRLGYPTAQKGAVRVAALVMDRINFFRSTALARLLWLPHRKGGNVIEVGFGNAQTLVQLRAAGWSVQGCEFDEMCIRQAHELELDVIPGNFADGIFPAESADAVVASHTIEHVPDPLTFIREAYRVLRPGGMLVLTTPNAESRGAHNSGRYWRGLETPRHLSIHTPGSLRLMAQQAKFDDIEVFGTPLGGFCLQQSAELEQGKRPSPSQSVKTMRYNVIASITAAQKNDASEEIVLRCMKAQRNTLNS